MQVKNELIKILRRIEKYTKVDMVYVVKGGSWLTIGKIITSLLSFATMIAFSHWLSKEIFGTYQYIIATLSVLSIFTLPGMSNALSRAVARGKEGMFYLCLKKQIKWGMAGSLLAFFIALWYFFHHNFILGSSFLIASFFFPFPNAFQLYISFWQGKKRFDIQNKYSILVNFLEALFFIPVIFLTNNLVVIILSYFITRTIFKAFIVRLTLKKVENQEKDKETIPFGKHLTLMGSLETLFAPLDNILLWQFVGPTAVAVYSFAQMPIARISELLPLGQLALPKLSQKDIKKHKKELAQKFLRLFLISIPLSTVLVLIAPLFYKIFFPQYLNAVPYFRVFTLTITIMPLGLFYLSLLTEMKKRELYIIRLSTPVLRISLFLVLVPFYGIWGVIFAILITQIFGAGLAFYFFRKI